MCLRTNLFRRLLLPLLDDALNAAVKELIHLVLPCVGQDFPQQNSREWKHSWTHNPNVLV